MTDQPLTPEQIAAALELEGNEATEMAVWVWRRALRQLQAQAVELDGYRKAYALLQKGMGSQAEIMDGLKQETRQQAAELERLRSDAIANTAIIRGLRESLDRWRRTVGEYDEAVRLRAEGETARADARAAGLANKEIT